GNDPARARSADVAASSETDTAGARDICVNGNSPARRSEHDIRSRYRPGAGCVADRPAGQDVKSRTSRGGTGAQVYTVGLVYKHRSTATACISDQIAGRSEQAIACCTNSGGAICAEIHGSGCRNQATAGPVCLQYISCLRPRTGFKRDRTSCRHIVQNNDITTGSSGGNKIEDFGCAICKHSTAEGHAVELINEYAFASAGGIGDQIGCRGQHTLTGPRARSYAAVVGCEGNEPAPG